MVTRWSEKFWFWRQRTPVQFYCKLVLCTKWEKLSIVFTRENAKHSINSCTIIMMDFLVYYYSWSVISCVKKMNLKETKKTILFISLLFSLWSLIFHPNRFFLKKPLRLKIAKSVWIEVSRKNNAPFFPLFLIPLWYFCWS